LDSVVVADVIEIRADVAASALERTELGNATTDTESWEKPLPHTLPRGCAVASERRGSTRAKANAPDEPRPPEEDARHSLPARRQAQYAQDPETNRLNRAGNHT